LTVAEKFMLSLVPISTKVPSLQAAWEHWANSLARRKICTLEHHPEKVLWQGLQDVEDTCRRYSAYAWLSYRQPDFFPSIEAAQEGARAASERVDSLLQAQNAAARKKQAGAKTGLKRGRY
jgi:ATP-dependent RNA helicase SUPV3L1/SUV3